MRFAASIFFSLLVTLGFTLPAFAQTVEDKAKIRAVIADWYQRVGQWEADAPDLLLAPRAIDGGPGYAETPYQPPGNRSAAAYWGGT
jgi:hypothetical protein